MHINSRWTMSLEARTVIEILRLEPLQPEGGFFREMYRSKSFVSVAGASRALATSIYYMMTKDSFSAFHRLKSDEVYHFYCGSPVELLLIHPSGELQEIVLGSDIVGGQIPQYAAPAGVWQAARVKSESPSAWSLLGTTVSPGFDFEDFELGGRQLLDALGPNHRTLVRSLTED